MTDLEVSVGELPAAIKGLRSTDSLTVRGGGILVGADLTNIAVEDLHVLLDDSIGALARRLLPSTLVTKVGRDIPVFDECDFSGLRGWFEPGIARFRRCRFLGVNVRGQLMQAHFIDCQFSGTWEANFTTEAAREDPASRVVISGNDFRALSGMDFFGVPESANALDTSGDHLVLRREHLADPAVRAVLTGVESGRRHIDRLDKGGEDWILLEREVALSNSEWQAMRTVVPRN
jgi:hypothetical protein